MVAVGAAINDDLSRDYTSCEFTGGFSGPCEVDFIIGW